MTRYHVSPVTKHIFSFDDEEMKKYVEDHHDTLRKVKGPTSRGVLVPAELPFITTFKVHPLIWKMYPLEWDMSTSKKGRAAENIVKEFLIRKENDKIIVLAPHQDRRSQLRGENVIIDTHLDEETQVAGIDITINMKLEGQVKCDFTAGPKRLKGSGNLYIETWERNPLKQH